MTWINKEGGVWKPRKQSSLIHYKWVFLIRPERNGAGSIEFYSMELNQDPEITLHTWIGDTSRVRKDIHNKKEKGRPLTKNLI